MISSDSIKICQEFRVTYRTHMSGGTVFAEIIDLDTGQSYIKAEGPDHQTAITEAISKVRTTPKPLTDSQAKVAAMLSGAAESIKAGDDRVAALEAQLAEAKSLLEQTAKRADLAEQKLDEVMSAEVPVSPAAPASPAVSQAADAVNQPPSAPVRSRTAKPSKDAPGVEVAS